MEFNSYETSILIPDTDLETLDREQLLEELNKTRQLCYLLREIIDELPDTIYVTDGNAKTMLVNKAYESLSGLDRKEILGWHMKKMEDKYISKSGSLVVLETGKEANIQLYFKKSKRSAFICSKPIFDDDGNIKMILSNSRNFEEIQQFEEKLINMQELAEHYREENDALKSQILSKSDITAEDKNMLNVLVKANKVACVDSTTLILGETGTGKEEVARFIYENSARSNEHFIKVNCGALSESLIESELFGYEKGAFTGANKYGKKGYFEVADKGILFLDEIGELPLDLQVKLLRVLQDNRITRIGGTEAFPVDVRVIAATNRDLKTMVEQKLFREDLYYRLNVIPIKIPPLRERKMDILPLATRFLNQFNEKYNYNKRFSSLACQYLLEYEWPGNVRELKNIVEQAIIMSEGNRISVNDLPFSLSRDSLSYNETTKEKVNLKERLEKIEFDYINQAYELHGSIRKAANYLGMHHSTYDRKRTLYMKKFT